jgi:ADP-ribose pyrophosphatase YjhB (NUDIX family)
MMPGATPPTNPFTIGVAGMMVRRRKVLLVKLGYRSRNWVLPGGYLKPDETLTEGVKREVREETGLSVEPLELISMRNRIRKDGRNDLYFVFLAKVIGGKLAPDGHETTDAAYFSLSEMEKRSDIGKINTLTFRQYLVGKKSRFRLNDYKPDPTDRFEFWA